MEKRARMAGFSGTTVLLGTALVALWSANCAYAQDAVKNTRIASAYNETTTSEPPSLATNFAERWAGEPVAPKEFVLGTDGVVKDANQQTDMTEAAALPITKIGAEITPFVDVTGSEADSPIARRASGSLSQIGAENVLASPVVGTKECGASPMTPDEIKALVVETARRHQVDEGFAVAITWAESRFDVVRNSPKGARGPMQLIPHTATRFGVVDVCDPAQNIEGGIKYLRFLLDEFQNPLLVAAAYNSGENRIYEYGGVPPFQETVGYVAKVLNFQLGLPMPTGKRKAGNVGREAAATNTANGSGVIAVEKTGKFVGGVMHF
ncbi:lytic transglycosylase domain-containing protein (plasmid) [Agrobacterium tumefaciens]|uniref:Lytic transglycosylase domain-containing protein n=2 Tax=Agrobacterium tumefaciens TaxID=358 RepID=A0AAJ4N9M3_AGRTU|nr:lytic transglycosylase domain-containing protein [Agrobacterium tumefaciens]